MKIRQPWLSSIQQTPRDMTAVTAELVLIAQAFWHALLGCVITDRSVSSAANNDQLLGNRQ